MLFENAALNYDSVAQFQQKYQLYQEFMKARMLNCNTVAVAQDAQKFKLYDEKTPIFVTRASGNKKTSIGERSRTIQQPWQQRPAAIAFEVCI